MVCPFIQYPGETEYNDVVLSVASAQRHTRDLSGSPNAKRRSKRSRSIATTSDYFASSRNQSKQSADDLLNFSHYPGGWDSSAERSFSRFYSSSASISTATSSDVASRIIEAEDLPPVSPQESYNSRHPPALSIVAQQAFITMSDSLLPGTPNPAPQWNPSELGIVHLPSIASSSRASSRSSKSKAQSSSSSASGSNSSHYFTPEDISSGDDGKHPSDGNGESMSSESSSLHSRDGAIPLVSVRFQHVQDENGHHTVTGREGQLKRCEDEPIRTPGAVQGFGVLIVVEEKEDTLVVRQVSENATELLGLPPRYLFNLECFTDILPESQAAVLWDNIQFLSEPLESNANSEDDVERDSPDIFLLSGYGAPGTVLQGVPAPSDPYDPWGVHEGKRRWTCWCAVHRPQPSPYLSISRQPIRHRRLVVMEFELENDYFNPLYHPPSPKPSPMPSGVQSPGSTNSNSSPSESNSSGSASSGSLQASPSVVVSENSLVSNSSMFFGSASSDGSCGGSGSSMKTLRNISDSEITPPVLSNSVSPQSLSDLNGDIGPLQAESGKAEISSVHGMDGDHDWCPSTEDILESTTTRSRPLLALERLRRMARMPGGSPQSNSPTSPGFGGFTRARRVIRRSTLGPDASGRRPGAPAAPGGVSLMDVFSLTAQINEQLGDAPDLETFLKVVVGVIKDITQFHRVLVYQFDEAWNGQVVAELVDWSMTHDLYKGLHFPAGDIPAQARDLYKINRVRILYDREQPTARIVVRSKEDLEEPLNMTHCYLRAMSPIHVKCKKECHFGVYILTATTLDLGHMGVRASMSVSIMAFGSLWGLVACHSYGPHGMRVSFPVRQMLRLLSQSISRNIERLSYAQRLHTRKLINTISSENHPTGYIVSNADDLLGLFDADFGILVIGDGAKILGPNQHGQEILIMAEYLRLKQFKSVSQAVTKDFPDLNLSTGLEIIAGLLCVPLSSGGKDFIAFLRKGQQRDVHWAGKPTANGPAATLEPRRSFKIWSETVAGRCRAWTDEQLETAGVLALVYGKAFWRQKESALQTTRLTNLLLSNASHEVTPPRVSEDLVTDCICLSSYLEMALNGPLDFETRDNLSRSHVASKDLTRLESGNDFSINEPFDLANNIQDAISIYRNEALRRNLEFEVDIDQCPSIVIGDAKKIRTVVQNLTANASAESALLSVKYTTEGKISVRCLPYGEPEGLRGPSSTAMEIVVADTGCGIAPIKLESMFREIEQVESAEPKTTLEPGVGLGLAVVARIVEQLGGQLRVKSKVGEGSQFSFLLPLSLSVANSEASEVGSSKRSRSDSSVGSLRTRSNEIDSIVEALASGVASSRSSPAHSVDDQQSVRGPSRSSVLGTFPVPDSQYPVRPIRVSDFDAVPPIIRQKSVSNISSARPSPVIADKAKDDSVTTTEKSSLRVLIVEDNDINRLLLAKRLRMDGHTVVNTTNGQEGLDKIISDRNFDCILMDINMPILNGFEASEKIREVELRSPLPENRRPSFLLNGRIPIFAVSASLYEQQRSKLSDAGMDGWILKPIDFKRLGVILKGVTDPSQRELDRYHPGCNWEIGGWLARTSTQNSPTRASLAHESG
ncbi:hypothetical protein D9757_007064 [Collybiopsis confluens]|uniref:Phytochrome n=1 Tax=Collybiopsis confluens TaxID=2823264 RepID=A0A8H5HCE3_9AGAR|nr:hypothetical protein D9757_007064 [Collybiopsis confluens]